MNGVSIKDITRFPPTPQAERLSATREIAPHVIEAHERLKEQTFPNPAVLAHTAPVSPGLALAAWEASEEAKTTPKPQQTRKGWVYSVGTHGFKSFRVSATRSI